MASWAQAVTDFDHLVTTTVFSPRAEPRMDQSPALTDTIVNPLMDPLFTSGGDTVLTMGGADVGRRREVQRRRRLWRLSAFAGIPAAVLWLRILAGHPVDLLQLPHIDWVVVVPM